MTTRQQNQRVSEIEGKPTFRIIDGVSIRFVESDPGDLDALVAAGRNATFGCDRPAGVWPLRAEGHLDVAARDERLHRSRGRRGHRVLRRNVDLERYDRAIMRTACL
jgi:hypothetical protein